MLLKKKLLNLGEGAVGWKRLYLYFSFFLGQFLDYFGSKILALRQSDCLSGWKSKKSEHKFILKFSYY